MPESLHDSLPALAVVGLSLKFPEDAVSPDAFWNMIIEGRCASKEVPAHRFNIDAHYHPDPNRLASVSNRGGHFLTEDSSLFDAPFFSITAAEAAAMDPQQRLTLETSYRAVESAGLTMEQLSRSKTCVFTGASAYDYQTMMTRDTLDAPKFGATGTCANMLSNRVSWFFNLLGPSGTIDTACSSSLVAIDLACKSIWSGDASMGIALGVNAILTLETTLSLSNLGLLSPDSRCFSFDERGNGFARGEGIGALVIRPLEDAVRNGDPIRAVIRSSGSNQDGRTPGITMPSMEMQEQLIRDTYHKGGLDLESTRYFEAHGTGTAVGDPIESKAIGSVFRSVRSADKPLYLGSVKSNIGHLEGGSGIAGALKTILALEKGVIPPNSENFERLNPRIDADFLNVKVAKSPVPWPTDGLRRASVSSFGFGGTNSHIVFDDALNYLKSRNLSGNHNTVQSPVLQDAEQDGGLKVVPSNENMSPKLLVWSTHDEKGIQRLQDTWKPFLSNVPFTGKTVFLHDLAYTLGGRRTHHPWKTFAVAGPDDDWTMLAEKLAPAQKSRASPNMAMVFSGQGAQWFAMGRELLQTTPLFLQSLKAATTYLNSIGCEWNLLEEFQKSQAESRVNKPEFSQTMCTALQVGLVDCLRSWNLVPHAVVGHSSGEIAAAYSANAISRESAWKIAYHRGRLSGRLEKSSPRQGSMLAVALSAKDVALYLEALRLEQKDANLNVACINSPTSVTISGDEVQVDALKEQFDEVNVFARKLKVGVGYHSAQMQEIADEYEDAMGVLEKPSVRQKPVPQMVSSVTGTWIEPKFLRVPRYWVRNMVSPVLFSDALSTVCSGSLTDPTKKLDYSHRRRKPIHHLIEVGPHAVLQGACKDILKALEKAQSVTYLSMLVRNVSAVETALSAVGNLHCAGYPVDLSTVNMDPVRAPRTLANLPEYSFDHSKSYWHEGLESKGFRHRRFGRNDLLGTPSSIWNPLEAHWRHMIRTSEMPWVADHKVNGSILYPGMGMLVMAIEGAKQLAEPGKAIRGFNIREASFSAAVRIPSNKRSIETGFFMRPVQDAISKSPCWFDFRLCSHDEGNWIECCAGFIQIVYSTTDPSPSQEDERISGELLAGQVKAYSDAQRKATRAMDNAALYDLTSRCGLGYGEAFQLIRNLSFHRDDDYQVVSQVRRGEKGNETIHPTTLDCVIQTALLTLSKSGTEMFPTVVPRRVEKMWISHENLVQGAQSELLRTHSTRFDDPDHGILGDIRAFDDTLQNVLVDVTGLLMNVISDTNAEGTGEDNLQVQRCHQLEWKPDPQLLTNAQVLKLCTDSMPDTFDLGNLFAELAFVIFARILRTLSDLRKQEYKPPQPHLRKYVGWMIEQERRMNDFEVPFAHEPWISRFNDPLFIEQVEERISKANARGYVVANVSRHLPQLLNGEIDPLTFLFGGTQLKDFYFESLYDTVGVHRLGAYLDVLSNHNNELRVIEVGAGTGSITDILMRSLGRTDDESSERRYARWDFTDISRSFFSEAQDLLKAEGDRVKFNSLDIEHEPSEQGFECGTYDMVVASLVLHATHDLKTTLINARKLLKPGGKLVLNELVAPDILRTSFIFGLLEGWWLSSESYRQFGPCVETSQWNDLLQQTGFSGVDLSLRDYEDPCCWECSILVATAVEESQAATFDSDIEIYYSKHSSRQTETAEALASHCQPLTKSSVKCLSIEDVPEAVSSASSLRIFLLDMERPMLHEMEPDLFFTLQHLFCSATDVMWINSGGGLSNSHPHYRVADGLFRAVSAEDDRKKCYVLSLDPRNGESQQQDMVDHTTKVIQSLLQAVAKNQIIDTEYVEDDGLLHIPRLVAPLSVNEEMSSRTALKRSKVQSFECGIPLQLDSANSNLLRGFKFIEDELAGQPLAPDEMEIQVKCSGVNFRDVLIAVGQLNSPHTGFECSGIVTRTGEECKRFQVGDPVALLNKGCFANFIRIRESGAVVKTGRNVSFSDAAAVPVNFATAFIAIHDVARMRANETILIHAAAGGTGQAAIQIAQDLGAEVFATVGSQRKKKFLMEVYGIPESHIFSSRSTLFAPAVKERTHGRGVDVIFNSLAGESLRASWECIAPYGRFLEIGIKDILANDRLPMAKFLHNVSFSAINLASMMTDRPDVCATALDSVFKMIADGRLQPARDVQLYGIGDMESAFRTMQSGKHIGKIVIEMRKDDQVTTVLETHPSTSLDANGTYIVSGGLGGLGRTIVTWLVDRGARNLLLLSRSGARSAKAAELLQELSAKGASVMIPRCDVADADSVARALSECQERMPPFKGCIQCAMVLRDSSFESMTHQAWQEVISPKVQGTWNLHQQLPSGMDFFIMLSSISGVLGSRGQANYAAGNTFQDALARHRVALGEKATSLDLGVIGFTGAVVEDAKLAAKFLNDSPFILITESEMRALLDMYCDPRAGPYTASTCQTVVRMAPKADKMNTEIQSVIEKPLCRRLRPQNGPGNNKGSAAESANVAAMLGEAQSLAEASAAVTQALTAKLSKALSIAMAELDANKPLHQYGVDSLVAVELRSWFTKEVQADVAVFDILGSSTISSIGLLATSKSKLKGEKW